MVRLAGSVASHSANCTQYNAAWNYCFQMNNSVLEGAVDWKNTALALLSISTDYHPIGPRLLCIICRRWDNYPLLQD